MSPNGVIWQMRGAGVSSDSLACGFVGAAVGVCAVAVVGAVFSIGVVADCVEFWCLSLPQAFSNSNMEIKQIRFKRIFNPHKW